MGQYNIDESKVKKPSNDRPLTKEQADEWIKCAKDKEYWMRTYVYVEGQSGETLFVPRPYQLRQINKMSQNRFCIFLAGRQCGKTTTMGVDILHDMVFFAGTKVGITSYKLANCKDFMDRIKFSLENLPYWMKPAVIEYNRYNIKFVNGSTVVSQVTKENTFRGITLNRIVADELAFVKPNIAEEFITSLLPSMSAQGSASTTRFQIISTANGTSGMYAQLWFGAVANNNGFCNDEVKYDEVPNRDAEFERSMVSKMGRDKFDQEFKNAFISNKGNLVNSRVIEAIQTKDPVQSIRDLDIYVENVNGRKLAMACDVSEGIGNDYHAFQVFDIDTFEQVAEFQNNVMTQTQYVKEIIRSINYFFSQGAAEIYYTYENNGVGAGVARLLENADDDGLSNAQLISDANGKKNGMCTTGKSKQKGCAQLKDLIELSKLKIYSEKLKTELKFFVKTGNSFAAETGTTDDLVMASVILMNMLEVLTNYEDKVYDVMNELEFSDGEDFSDIFF